MTAPAPHSDGASVDPRVARLSDRLATTAGNGPAPFFEAPGGSPTARRLLLVSPLFVPDQRVGVLRWQKMAHYVAERGWQMDVITIHPDCIESPDWSRLGDLPPGTRLYGVRTSAPGVTRAIERAWEFVRRNRRAAVPAHATTRSLDDEIRASSCARNELRWSLTRPRAYVRIYNVLSVYAELWRWARDGFSLARHLVRAGTYDAVISSGPPHAAHETARRIAHHTGLPFVMDMRDVWSLMQRCQEPIATPLTIRLASWHERRSVDQATLLVMNTEAARSAMIKTYPEASDRMLAVMNGFDDEPLPRTHHGSQFVIAYAGSIYLDRDPRCLFRAARLVIEALRLSPRQLAVKFIGAHDWSTPLAELAKAEGIAEFVSIGPSRPRAEALEFLARATMLVILPQDSDMAIPAKLFEYVRCEAWLLAVAEPDSATAFVLRDTEADVVSSRDVTRMADAIRCRYEQFAAGHRPRRIASDARLSRRHQAHILLDAIEGCVAANTTQRLSRPAVA